MKLPRPFTVADVERIGSAGERMELFDGVLREKPGEGGRHGEVVVSVLIPLYGYVRSGGLGRVYPSPTQFAISRDPDTIVIPDASFVRAERLPPENERWGIAHFAPDLVAEILSTNDHHVEVTEKVERYHRAGVRFVWLVDSWRRVVEVHALGQPPRVLHESETLDGGDLLPGFMLPVGDVFR